jgi:hypothetical protein
MDLSSSIQAAAPAAAVTTNVSRKTVEYPANCSNT